MWGLGGGEGAWKIRDRTKDECGSRTHGKRLQRLSLVGKIMADSGGCFAYLPA